MINAKNVKEGQDICFGFRICFIRLSLNYYFELKILQYLLKSFVILFLLVTQFSVEVK